MTRARAEQLNLPVISWKLIHVISIFHHTSSLCVPLRVRMHARLCASLEIFIQKEPKTRCGCLLTINPILQPQHIWFVLNSRVKTLRWKDHSGFQIAQAKPTEEMGKLYWQQFQPWSFKTQSPPSFKILILNSRGWSDHFCWLNPHKWIKRLQYSLLRLLLMPDVMHWNCRNVKYQLVQKPGSTNTHILLFWGFFKLKRGSVLQHKWRAEIQHKFNTKLGRLHCCYWVDSIMIFIAFLW